MTLSNRLLKGIIFLQIVILFFQNNFFQINSNAETNLVFTNDATILGLLIMILAGIFYAEKSNNKYLVKFFKYIPGLLLCYFIPSIFNSLGFFDSEESNLYFVASRYLLPATSQTQTLWPRIHTTSRGL